MGARLRNLSDLTKVQKDFKKIQYELDYEELCQELGLEVHEYRQQLWCSCPLPFGNHKRGDRNPSFSINNDFDHPSFGCYNCFVCGGGTILHLVALLKEINTDEAYEWIRTFAHEAEDDDKFLEMLERASREPKKHEPIPMPEYPNDTLFKYRFIHPWMKSQGMTEEAIKHFQIGYDEDKNAILIPHWWRGKLVGWQARTLTGEGPKYKNSQGFPKRNTLFNFDEQDGNEIILVESPKTAVILWGWGYHNVVATFGASLSKEQMMPLWKFDRILLWFDNDEAGTKATRTAIQYLERHCDVYVVPPVNIDKGDPADINPDAIPVYLQEAIPSALWRG